jgi:hypothetical protein
MAVILADELNRLGAGLSAQPTGGRIVGSADGIGVEPLLDEL